MGKMTKSGAPKLPGIPTNDLAADYTDDTDWEEIRCFSRSPLKIRVIRG